MEGEAGLTPDLDPVCQGDEGPRIHCVSSVFGHTVFHMGVCVSWIPANSFCLGESHAVYPSAASRRCSDICTKQTLVCGPGFATA